MMRRQRSLLTAEIALAVVSAAAVIGMHRLFADGTYRPSLLLQAVMAHVVVALLRRARVPLVPAALVALVAAALTLCWNHYLSTTVAFVPTGDTWSTAGDDLAAAWRLFQDVRAPAPVDAGFLVAGGAAVWVAVFVADWAAFRAGATFEALLPSATLFLFAAALGAPGGRVLGATVYTAAAMAFVLLQRTLHQEESAAWAASQRAQGRWSLLGTGALLTGVAVVVGALAGPNLPGAQAEPLIAWRDMDGDEPTRVVVSPMVDLQTRLIDQPNVELFTVRSSQPSYWRLTALDEFDGQIWKSSYGTNDADGELPHPNEVAGDTALVRQSFSITALAAVWLPAAFDPRTIDPGSNEVDWDSNSSTFIADGDEQPSSDGFRYTVESALPLWSSGELRSATDPPPPEIAETYLELPRMDPRVQELADQITAGAASPYEKALALQSHLRSDDFVYDLNVSHGHSNDALTTFLFRSRRGYCEQFAGSFAALARAAGIPARVAVGFSPGVEDPADPGLYHVWGRHAHAWAEVWLGEYGWVVFDPTPGRAPPLSEQWLGIPPDQEGEGNGDGTTATTAPATSPVPGPETGPQDAPGEAETGPAPTLPSVGEAESDGGSGGTPFGMIALVAALAALAYAVAVPAAAVVVRASRRRRARTPTDRVRLAWREAGEAATAAGTPIPASLTVGETTGRLARAVPEVADSVHRLAALTEAVVYAEAQLSPEDAAAAVADRRVVVTHLAKSTPLPRRLARLLDVRGLWRHRSTTDGRRRVQGATLAPSS